MFEKPLFLVSGGYLIHPLVALLWIHFKGNWVLPSVSITGIGLIWCRQSYETSLRRVLVFSLMIPSVRLVDTMITMMICRCS